VIVGNFRRLRRIVFIRLQRAGDILQPFEVSSIADANRAALEDLPNTPARQCGVRLASPSSDGTADSLLEYG
jgi:hypothetical protein